VIYGIDYDTFGVYVCGIPFDFDDVATRDDAAFYWIPLRLKRESGEASLWRALADADLSAELPNFDSTDLVWIERGFGMSRRADFALGAVMGAIITAAARTPATISVIDLREWKREVMDNAKEAKGGNVAKDVVQRYLHERYPLTIGRDPNLVDAFGIALGGLRLNARALART
jgi:hypothetical protein